MNPTKLSRPYWAVTLFAISLAALAFQGPLGYAAEASGQQDTATIQVNRQSSTPVPAVFEDAAVDPFEEMQRMQQSFNKILRESMRRMKNYQQAGKFFEPDADFVEKDGNYFLTMDLPGMQKNQIQIEATESAITISGERQTERQSGSDKEGAYQFERSSGTFYRRMSLPSDADSDQIAAKYENGVLEITIPRIKQPSTEKKKIAIQ